MDHRNIPFFFPFFFVGAWLLVTWIVAKASGWSRLAAFYRAPGPFEGETLKYRSGRFGWTNYNGCLTLGADQEGFYLSIMSLFRLGSPPLYIPWKDMTASEGRLWFVTVVSLEFARAPGIVFKTQKKTMLRLKEMAGNPPALSNIV